MSDNIPDWAIERARELYAAHITKSPDAIFSTAAVRREAARCAPWAQAMLAFARYISEHEQPPVDPLLAEAIEMVVNDDVTRTENQIAAIRERRAGHEKVNLALRALRRGIEIATGGEK